MQTGIKMKSDRLHGYLIEKYSHMGKAYTCARLQEEARARGVSLDIIGVSNIKITPKASFHLNKNLKPKQNILKH